MITDNSIFDLLNSRDLARGEELNRQIDANRASKTTPAEASPTKAEARLQAKESPVITAARKRAAIIRAERGLDAK